MFYGWCNKVEVIFGLSGVVNMYVSGYKKLVVDFFFILFWKVEI